MVNQDDMQFLQLLSRELGNKSIKLPSFPDAVIKIRDALEKEDCDIQRIAQLASAETMLASRLMQAANSAFFNSAGSRINDLNAAVMRLGLKEVRNMAIALAVEQIFIAKEHPSIAKDLATLWRRSVSVSSVAFVLARECSDVDPEQAFLCGLLHEVGKLYMLTKAEDFPGVTVDMLACSDDPNSWHPQVGRCIVESWGFSEEIVETLEPVEYLNENRSHPTKLLDVVFAAEMVCAANPKVPLDYEHVCLARLELNNDRLAELQPAIVARRDTMVRSLS